MDSEGAVMMDAARLLNILTLSLTKLHNERFIAHQLTNVLEITIIRSTLEDDFTSLYLPMMYTTFIVVFGHAIKRNVHVEYHLATILPPKGVFLIHHYHGTAS